MENAKTVEIRYPLEGSSYSRSDLKSFSFVLERTTTFPKVGNEVGLTFKAGTKVRIQPTVMEN